MKKLKLNNLANEKLLDQEMKLAKGGLVCGKFLGDRGCGCGCYYANSGGSGTYANCDANFSGGSNGLTSPNQ